MKYVAPVVLAAALVATTGCSSNSGVAVSGTVTRSGKPVETATIEFMPENGSSESSAKVNIAQGLYQIPASKGLKPGKYAVEVEMRPSKEQMMQGAKGFRNQSQQAVEGKSAVIDIKF